MLLIVRTITPNSRTLTCGPFTEAGHADKLKNSNGLSCLARGIAQSSFREEGEVMNLLLLLVVICGIGLGICTWLSSACLRWLSAHLLTRADVIDAARDMNVQRMHFWRGELGVVDHSVAHDEQAERLEIEMPAAVAKW